MSAIIALQFGLATSFAEGEIACALTSGTTSGTSSCILNAEELSITTAPAARAAGTNSFERLAPAQKKATSISLKEDESTGSTSTVESMNASFDPADLELANARKEATGKSRLSNTLRNSDPTAPVAPTTATHNFFDIDTVIPEDAQFWLNDGTQNVLNATSSRN